MTDEKKLLKFIMIDILNLRNGMEDNLRLIQQINLMIQKEGEKEKRFDDVIHAAQQHIDSINTVYTLGVSWLKDDTDFALSFIQGNLLEEGGYSSILKVALLILQEEEGGGGRLKRILNYCLLRYVGCQCIYRR